MVYKHILQLGRNCWRIRHADRIAFLVDGAAYFQILHRVLPKADHDIMISSWDIYSGLRLGAMEGDDSSLAEIFARILQNNTQLTAYILNWDFSILFAMSREWLPEYKFGWRTHSRLKFQLDDQHPVGASHHQKIVVLDDKLAFTGGVDLTRGRWDTPEHKANESRRKKVDGTIGRPYHDIQVAISGDAAAALGDLFRERWRRATHQKLSSPSVSPVPLWPDGLTPDLEQVNVAISRTEPRYQEYQEVREIEQLYLDAIAAAEDYIYLENQYFTSPRISHSLAERLTEQNGPEIIINLPLETEGWLTQNSLDMIRVKLLHELREADTYQHLAVYYPFKKDLKTMPINVHTKLMIVDDRFIKVGSSNLNNRSMRLDTECDVSVECRPDDERIKHGISDFRNRLLAEHLGVDAEQVGMTARQQTSVIKTIETIRSEDAYRSLMPLEAMLPKFVGTVLTDSQLVDPEEPVNIDSMLYHHIPEEEYSFATKRITAWLLGLFVLLLVAAAWQFTPLGERLYVDNITRSLNYLRGNTLSSLLLLIGFVFAGLIMVPVTLLIITMVMVYGPLIGFGYSLIGTITCALVAYALGSFLGRDAIKGLTGGRISRISQRLADQGILTIVFVRIVPIAPFTIINLVAGASHIRLRDFVVGSVLGLIPGITAIALLTDRIRATFENPDLPTTLLLITVATVIIAISFVVSRYLMRRQARV